jgi:hypothetical protein
VKLLLNGPLKIPISSVSTEYSRKEQITKQNKTIQDAPRKGRNLTSGGLLPYSLPHDNASSRPSPSSATCSSIKAVSIAGIALDHFTSFHRPFCSRHNPTVCLSVTKLQTADLQQGIPSKFNRQMFQKFHYHHHAGQPITTTIII